jgi:four helix bundle protein
MATIKIFEELEIWQQSRLQCQRFFELMQAGCLNGDAPLRDQMNRSSGSVMDNIAEGFDRFSRADFRNFLVVARGSNAEFRSQCYRCKDRGHMTEAEADHFIRETRHLGIKINSLIRHLDQSDYKSKPRGSNNDVKEPIVAYDYQDADFYFLPQSFISPI